MDFANIVPDLDKRQENVDLEMKKNCLAQGTNTKDEGRVSPAYTRSKMIQANVSELLERKCVCVSSESPELDAYKILRTQILQKTRGKGHNTIMVTSVGEGEGKTLTSINLALTLAREFSHTVLLVDGDLKKQDIHKVLGFESLRGLADNLLEDVPLSELIVWPEIEKLTVISGGKTIQESSELLGSPRMKELMTEMKERYSDRYVIFDVPAISKGADALAFAPLVDGIVVVLKHGETTEKEVKKALRLLPRDKVLGFVVNGKKGN